MNAHEFSIASGDLDASGKRFRFVVRAAWIRSALENTGLSPAGTDGDLEVRLSKSGTDVVVRGALTAELHAPCARCLQPARVAVTEQIGALVVPAGSQTTGQHGPADEEDLVADQADVIPYDGETVVLDDLVRDELLLGVPMIPLCSESCPGIRPQPTPESDDREIDPRLRPLLRLKKSST
jgi:uncharacterized protein